MTFSATALTESQLRLAQRFISSESLAAIIIHRLVTNQPTSLVRMGDGERCIIAKSLGQNINASFLSNPTWLRKYGLFNADIIEVGKGLLKAGNDADFFGPSIAGFWMASYNLFRYIDRPQYVDVFYNRIWQKMGRLEPVLKAANGIIVFHRDHVEAAKALSKNYGLENIAFGRLNSWEDHSAVKDRVKNSPEQLVLISGGPSAKLLTVELAKETGKVVLDVGGCLPSSWCGIKETLNV